MDQKKIKSFLKKVKKYENTLSVVFGVVFIVVIGVLVLRLFDGKKGEITNPGEKDEYTSKLEQTYRVQKGDHLWKIAEKYYSDGHKWTEIAKANSIKNPGVIEIDKEITIPVLDQDTTSNAVNQTNDTTPTATTSEIKNIITEQGTYTVVSGDSLWKICEKIYNNGYKWVDVAKANNIKNPDIILPGMSLTLPQ